jgi:hypothetical protein
MKYRGIAEVELSSTATWSNVFLVEPSLLKELKFRNIM